MRNDTLSLKNMLLRNNSHVLSLFLGSYLLGLNGGMITPLEAQASEQVYRPNSEMFPHEQTSRVWNPISYIVNSYRIQVENVRNSTITPPCRLLRLSPVEEEPLFPCYENLPPYAILPASIGTTPADFYYRKKRFSVWSYSPQELVLITGLIHAYYSVKVVEVRLENKQWVVTVDLNKSAGSFSGGMIGTIVQVDLGYLIPNDYQATVIWNFKEDGILISSFTDTLDFRVFDEIHSPYSPNPHLPFSLKPTAGEPFLDSW